jgi:hypothetical protein
MAITPTRQVLQRGTYANDGTGDTLRDAAQKINDNFTYLWNDVYDGAVVQPGRKFTLNATDGTEPDSGGFTLLNDDLDVDSAQTIRISRWDQSEKSFKTSLTDSAQGFQVSLWSLDSGTLDNWNLMARYEGNIYYNTTHDNWNFTKTSTLLATQDGLDSGSAYYIKLDGVW